MRPQLLHIVPAPSVSYNIRHDVVPALGGQWHFHPELELHFVIKGEGLRFIGDTIANFSAGDLILLGENLPHCWKCGPEYYQNDPSLNAEVIVLHFRPTFMGNHLLNLPEAYMLPRLFKKAKSGMVIYGYARSQVVELMHQALKADHIDRIIILLKILQVLAETENYDSITRAGEAFVPASEADGVRLNKVISYALNHFKEEFDLNVVAEISNLSTTSFCRYFKQMTQKSYVRFLTEVRVTHACRLLREGHLPTAMICFDSGFNNISNFYRHFQRITGMTPTTYRQKYARAPRILVGRHAS